MHILSIGQTSETAHFNTTVSNSALYNSVTQRYYNINNAVDKGINIIKEQLKTHANMQLVWAKRLVKLTK